MIAPEGTPDQLSTSTMTVFGSYDAIRTLKSMKPTFNESYLLLNRQFEGRVKPKEVGQIFRVMEWNMLAQGLSFIKHVFITFSISPFLVYCLQRYNT